MIPDSPTLTAKEIAKKLGMTPRAVEKQVANLKKVGLLHRIGPDKGGHWEVIDMPVDDADAGLAGIILQPAKPS